MKIVPIIPVTPSIITATNLALTDHAIWSPGTYAAGEKVTHADKNWEAKISTTAEPGTSTADWLELGAVNYLKMFDGRKATATVGDVDTVMTYSLFFNTWLNTLKIADIEDCESVRVVLDDPTEGIVLDRTIELVDYTAPDAYEYFFSDITYHDQVTIDDLPPYYDATINVTLTPLSGKAVSVGTIVIGKQIYIGILEFGYSVGFDDYSLITFDQFGAIEDWVQRGYADTASLPITVPTEMVYDVKKRIAALRGASVLWMGSPDHKETHVIGIFDSFGITVSNPVKSDCSISLKGVI